MHLNQTIELNYLHSLSFFCLTIAPFWKAVIKSSLNLKSIVGLMKSGFSTIRGAYAMLLMLRGFNAGVIKFGLITCTKPESK
jgi:tocopherol O-methyltransferase